MRARRTPIPQPLERERSAGVVVLGEARWVHWRWIGLQTLIALVVLAGIVFSLDYLVMATDGAQPDLAALTSALQQMLQEQQQQRAQIESLSQAVQGTGSAVQATQAVTEQVVTEVVSQVQAGFHHEQQQSQEQLTQVGTILTTLQEQMQQMGQALQQVQQQQVSVSDHRFQESCIQIQGLHRPGHQTPAGGGSVAGASTPLLCLPVCQQPAAGQVVGGDDGRMRHLEMLVRTSSVQHWRNWQHWRPWF